ncbi:similar to ring finger protein 123 [Ectocarpus siliculosus]|uniref:Similar to ring finger protein 123 n=1 Tax=Ectocarpus siliculosus TaxID=2880 RepID=D7G771_ECTSI|nr:similar to ring finger protein 123 [Ectocarpus siliculosus]|eukprot:CBJ25764.1 similar to ring finger protein 123 [Ectocarpus siliculosus]
MSREIEYMEEESIPCPIVLLRGEMLTEEMDGLYRVTTKENAVSDILTVRLACGAGDAATFSGSRLYYEARVESGGAVVLGLAGPGFDEGVENQPERPGVGDVMPSWAFDGARRRKRTRQISNMYGQRWKAGDMVGVLLDIDTKEISFSLNGKDLGPAFTLNDEEVKGLYPAASLHFGQAVVFNFGRAPFEYNPRERGSKPQEPAIIEAPAKPKSRRKSTPTKPAAAAPVPAAPAPAAAASAAAVGPRAGKGKRAKGESAGAGGADGVDDEPASDGDAEPVYVDKKAADATGGSGSGSSSMRSNGHTQAGGRGKGSNNASSAGVDVESEAQAEFDRQTKEIDGLLRHETLLEGMHEMHTRHRRERKALLATQRKEGRSPSKGGAPPPFFRGICDKRRFGGRV